MARKPTRKRRRAPARPSRNWSLGTYLQWLPVLSVGVSALVGYVQLKDQVDVLTKQAPTTSIAEELTNLRDRIAVTERDEDRMGVKEAADVAEMKANDQQLWQAVGRQRGIITP